jgi:hypothetical protein
MDKELIHTDNIQDSIFTFRELQVMIDRDLATLYCVETKVLNQAVKRNRERFPENFRFQLSDKEKQQLVTDCDRFEKLKHSSNNPYAYTEQGVAMLSAVLHSKTAIKVSIHIMQAFVEMKKFIATNAGIFHRLDKVEQKILQSDENFKKLFKALEDRKITPKQDIFFKDQVFDAYSFVSNLVRTANTSIILIDNYIDDTVLTHFTKRKKNVKFTILTKNISKQLKLDIKKYQEQYQSINIIEFRDSHDRFLIIDEKEIYHFGASLKDLGKKWFAFSKMNISSIKIIDKLKEKEIL